MTFTVRTIKQDPAPKKQSALLQKMSATTKKATRALVTQTKASPLLQKIFIVALATLGSFIVLAILLNIVLQINVLNLSTMFSTIPTDRNGFINVVLIGNGGAGHDGVDLTDTIIVASIDPKKTKSVVMVSIPRDTLVTTQYFGEKSPVNGRRINSVFRDIKYDLIGNGTDKKAANIEALQLFEQEIVALTGLEIFGSIKVDFTAFEQVIDALGGIEIDVPEAIYDSTYPNDNWGYEPFSIRAGKQVLDGATALKYARSRHTTSDFDRSARQQQIISALVEKTKALGMLSKPSQLIEIATIVRDNYQSTIKLTDIARLAPLGRTMERDNMLSYQFNDRTGYESGLPQPAGLLYPPPREEFNGAAVLLPVSIPEYPITWEAPQAFIQFTTQHRELLLANPSFAVLNAGAKPGTARQMAQDLQRFGLRVEVIETAEGIEDIETSFVTLSIPTDSKGKPVLDEDLFDPLIDLYDLRIDDTIAIDPEQKKIFTIVAGKDFTYTPIQKLLLQ